MLFFEIVLVALQSIRANLFRAALTMLGIIVGVGVGLFFGIRPARHAARLDPVETLRYE